MLLLYPVLISSFLAGINIEIKYQTLKSMELQLSMYITNVFGRKVLVSILKVVLTVSVVIINSV